MAVDHHNLEERLTTEVETMHTFIAAWFRGEMTADKCLFEREFTSRLAIDMVNIQPSGSVLTRDRLAQSIFQGHGTNKRFQIQIHDCQLRYMCSARLTAVATYVESQRNAKNTVPADNDRISTAVFGLSDGGSGLRWVHLHETARSR
ncbi:MAG: hypothetical protein ACR2PG_13025 [Hyphomicrobiaceae bacterium]